MGNAATKAGGQGQPGMGRMLMVMPLMMMVSKVDMKDENNLLMARTAWLAVIGLQHMIFSIIVSGKIKSANDQTVIYAPPPPPQRGEMTKTTYCEHETQQVKVFKSQLFMNTLLMFGIHWYFGVAVLPLMQTLLGPLNMVDNVLFKKHVLGHTVEKAWGELTEAEYKAKQHEEAQKQCGAEEPLSARKHREADHRERHNHSRTPVRRTCRRCSQVGTSTCR